MTNKDRQYWMTQPIDQLRHWHTEYAKAASDKTRKEPEHFAQWAKAFGSIIEERGHTVMHKNIWVRCGDQDDYNKFSSLQEVADYLSSLGCADPLFHYCKMGLTDNDYYRGQNYISAYWGGNEADDVGRELTFDEISQLCRLLEYANRDN